MIINPCEGLNVIPQVCFTDCDTIRSQYGVSNVIFCSIWCFLPYKVWRENIHYRTDQQPPSTSSCFRVSSCPPHPSPVHVFILSVSVVLAHWISTSTDLLRVHVMLRSYRLLRCDRCDCCLCVWSLWNCFVLCVFKATTCQVSKCIGVSQRKIIQHLKDDTV